MQHILSLHNCCVVASQHKFAKVQNPACCSVPSHMTDTNVRSPFRSVKSMEKLISFSVVGSGAAGGTVSCPRLCREE